MPPDGEFANLGVAIQPFGFEKLRQGGNAGSLPAPSLLRAKGLTKNVSKKTKSAGLLCFQTSRGQAGDHEARQFIGKCELNPEVL
jgi:hypothetical protein